MRGVALEASGSAACLCAFAFVASGRAARVDGAVPDAGAAACGGGGGAPGRVVACCAPITQPAIRPNRTPAMPKATASLFMGTMDHIRAPRQLRKRAAPALRVAQPFRAAAPPAGLKASTTLGRGRPSAGQHVEVLA